MRACRLCTLFVRLLLLAEGGGCVFGANGGVIAPVDVEFPSSNNTEITHWADEAEMRKRMKGYAERIFSHHYHLRRNKTLTRPKRDGGMLSGPLATALSPPRTTSHSLTTPHSTPRTLVIRGFQVRKKVRSSNLSSQTSSSSSSHFKI
uniref:Uncharacterized protein n=1 Tax=Ascaris lumbricoides TaxID=6252 RepID=A0A9J2PCV2_ASCLU